MADGDQKIEFELALRESMSVALQTVGREMAKLNKQAQETAQSGSGLRNIDSLLTSMGRSLLGPLGIAAGFVAAAKSLDTFAISQLQIRNFARDTGFSTEQVSKLRAQLAIAGIDAGRASAAIGGIGQKIQDAASIPFGSEMVKQLLLFNPELARTVQHFASTGEQIKVLQAIHDTYVKSSLAQQNLITQATGLTRSEILATGRTTRDLAKDWVYPTEASEKYHKDMYNLSTSLSNIWRDISQHAVEEISKVTGSWEEMDAKAHEVADNIKKFMDESVIQTVRTTVQEFNAIVGVLDKIQEFLDRHGGKDDPLKTAPPVPQSESDLSRKFRRFFGRQSYEDEGTLPQGARPISFTGDVGAFAGGGLTGLAQERGHQVPGWMTGTKNFLNREDLQWAESLLGILPMSGMNTTAFRAMDMAIDMMQGTPRTIRRGMQAYQGLIGGGDSRDLVSIESDSNKILVNIREILERMETGAHGGQGGSGGIEVYGGGIRGGNMQAGLGGFRPRGGSEGAQTGRVNLPQNRRETAAIVAEEWRKAGMSEAGIAGVMANIRSESGFNPTLRHADQPRFSGEAHYAHGLYQEGGDEWNNYARWLRENYPDADWRDPRLQSRFAAERLKNAYPSTWAQMQHGSKEEAAVAYVRGYLKPAAGYQANRSAQYMRGIPGIEAYTGTDTARSAIDGSLGKSAGAGPVGTLNAEVDFKNVPPGVRTSADGSGFKLLKVTATKQAQRAGEGMLYPGDSAYTPWVP